ncbi:MAG: YqjF family protein [Solirubrobacteraceae bacterium]
MIRRILAEASAAGESVISVLPGAPAELSQARVLAKTQHRPWAVPEGPWLMAQTWRDLLFAHWPVPPDLVRQVLPPALAVDTFAGSAWIGITPFEVTGLRPRGTPPLPGVSSFPELNVRTYTTVADKPGIYFLSLDAASRLAVIAARRAYRLPYFHARMTIERRPPAVDYRSDRTSGDGPAAGFEATYRPVGDVFHAEPGTLDHFVAERYCLYTVNDTGQPLRGEIHHPPWPLQAAQAMITVNTMTLPWGIELPSEEPLLHFSRLQNVVIWPLRPVSP